MAVRPAQRDSADVPALLDMLDAIRLDRDWTYRELSADMIRAEQGLSAQTLHQVLRDRSTKPFDRTIHKIRAYLELQRAAASGSRRRAAAR